MLKKCKECKSFKSVIFLIFLILSTLLLHKYSTYLSKEGMNSYEEMKPSIDVLYKDRLGNEISNLGNYGRCLIINDEIQLCKKQEYIYHEMIVHMPTMYLKKDLQNVVIIGGGDLMALREVMKYHTIENVFILEIDSNVVDICEKYFNESKYEDDPRVEIIYGDANDTIENILENYEGEIDLVVIDTTEDNENNNSTDTPQFFTKCFDLLTDAGIIVKNGKNFKNILDNLDDKYTISYNVDIPYFQEKYYFTIASNAENNIHETDLQKDRWAEYEIKTDFYKPKNHNKYIIYKDYKENVDE
jgi:spermidine synthase